MVSRQAILPSIVLLLALTGCASRKEIRTDGQIWVRTVYGTDYAAYQECITKAARDQAGRGAAKRNGSDVS